MGRQRLGVGIKKPSRWDVFLVSLDPTMGAEIKKTRPAVIISPDELNHHLRTVIIAPMTTKLRRYPSRVRVSFRNKDGEAALDQMRAIDKSRLVKRLGKLSAKQSREVTGVLFEMFA